jgi:transcriptional regulator with XRE-family HTH domain
VDLTHAEVRALVERVFARRDALDACAERDLGRIITILKAHGVTQGQISELTGIAQGRLSEWVRGKRVPQASSTFESFARGLGIPSAARQALGLAPQPVSNPGVRPTRLARGRATASTRSTTPRAPRTAMAELGTLRGLERVHSQLDDAVAVLAAEQGRKNAGLPVRRLAWKNLVFTGGPGTGKSRTAAALGQAYRNLGVLSRGHVIETAAADLVETGPQKTATLMTDAIRPASGGILLIDAAHDWYRLPDCGRHMMRRLYAELTEYRQERKDELAVILAGEAGRLQKLLDGNPSVAARFRAVIHFPGYTTEQLAAIFAALAEEAGLRLTPSAGLIAATVLAKAEGDHGTGNARLAVRLLNQATEAQARRVARMSSGGRDPAALITITEADIPDSLPPYGTATNEDWPGQYL